MQTRNSIWPKTNIKNLVNWRRALVRSARRTSWREKKQPTQLRNRLTILSSMFCLQAKKLIFQTRFTFCFTDYIWFCSSRLRYEDCSCTSRTDLGSDNIWGLNWFGQPFQFSPLSAGAEFWRKSVVDFFAGTLVKPQKRDVRLKVLWHIRNTLTSPEFTFTRVSGWYLAYLSPNSNSFRLAAWTEYRRRISTTQSIVRLRRTVYVRRHNPRVCYTRRRRPRSTSQAGPRTETASRHRASDPEPSAGWCPKTGFVNISSSTPDSIFIQYHEYICRRMSAGYT